MPPAAYCDPQTINCDELAYTREAIYQLLPQAHEMAMLDGIPLCDEENQIFAAYRDIRDDEWWCRGHMPSKAIFPGVLMIESAAQLCAFSQKMLYKDCKDVMGFGAINDGKFRDSVFPPNRVILIAKVTDPRLRCYTCGVQAFVDGRMAFECSIRGINLNLG